MIDLRMFEKRTQSHDVPTSGSVSGISGAVQTAVQIRTNLPKVPPCRLVQRKPGAVQFARTV